jgi:hypothetical protein
VYYIMESSLCLTKGFSLRLSEIDNMISKVHETRYFPTSENGKSLTLNSSKKDRSMND